MALGFLITAFLYATVGFGGGSTYNALLLLNNVDYNLIPKIALTCNIIVVTGSAIRYYKNNLIPWKIAIPLILVSIPFALLGGSINIDKETDFSFPDDFMDLEYQKQAVVAASKIQDAYNGVFLADVVGLGKTYIAALLAQQPNLKPARKLFIVPPVLQDYWQETLNDFGVNRFKVMSAGQIKNIKDWDKLEEVEKY